MHWLTRQWIGEHSAALIALVVIAGAATYSLFIDAPTSALDAVIDTKVTVEGIIIRDPDVREGVVQLTLDVGEEGYVLVRTDKFKSFTYGDRVRASGKVELPAAFETDSGRTFDYPKYLLAHGITHTMSFAQVSVTNHKEGNAVIATLLKIKHTFIDGIEAALPEPESALLGGLLLGEKRGLGDELTELFRRAGVIHIIVLSGYNVAQVIGAVRAVATRVLPRTAALGVSGVVALLFMLMTGASETAIRATMMALVVLLAQALYRPAVALRILLVVAAGMAVYNPMLVLFDLSYQLSVLATLGLILFSEPLYPYLTWLRSKTLIEITATSIATQIAVLPILIFSIGQISLVSVVTNILILVPVPYAMLAGGVAAALALISPALALPFSTVAYALLAYIIKVSAFMGALPFAAISI